jgi:reactive chlorine resistance protein C
VNKTGKVFEEMARMDRWAISITRLGLIVVLVWIGSLKMERYEADGIVPMVANSPLMSFF